MININTKIKIGYYIVCQRIFDSEMIKYMYAGDNNSPLRILLPLRLTQGITLKVGIEVFPLYACYLSLDSGLGTDGTTPLQAVRDDRPLIRM